MNKTKITLSKPVYLGLSISDISRIVIYEYWYHYAKPKYGDHVRLCLHRHIKSEEVYTGDFETRFDVSHYEINRPIHIIKNKKVIGLMKDVLSKCINECGRVFNIKSFML